jgi:uridine kinase
MTVNLDQVISRIVQQRSVVAAGRSLLVGISGIDGCGKGHVTKQIEARLAGNAIATANINVDGWLNLPDQRFSKTDPGPHFYRNAIRFSEMFSSLVLPLRDHRCAEIVADVAGESAAYFHKRPYAFKDVSVILLEGIFLFKSEFRSFFDLAIWVDCSFPTALARALQRRQERLSPAATIDAYETIYFPAQRIHLDRDDPRSGADLIFNNDPYFEKSVWFAEHLTALTQAQRAH